MDLRQLKTFLEAAKTLNFTRTAEALNYAQSSVTMQIQALEDELGVRLFDRLGKSLALTSAGERLFAYAQRILELVEEARTVVSSGEVPRGAIEISSVESLCTYRLPPLLQAFRRRYPEAHIVLQPGVCAQIQRDLVEGRFDAAFVLDHPVRSPHLVAEPLIEEELVVLAHPEHPLASKDCVRPADLSEDQVILVTEAGCSYRALFEQSLAEAGVRPQTVLEFGSVAALKQCALAGMGVTVLPKMAVQAEIESGQLIPLAWTPKLGSLYTQLVFHKDKWISPALSALIETAREVLGSNGGNALAS